MPELPEVETVRKGLERLVTGKKIQSVDIFYPRMVLTGASDLTDKLQGQEICELKRRGKYLIFVYSDWVMVSHLRMEGKYLYDEGEAQLNKHTHAVFHFTDGSQLVYQDVRKFGTMELMKKSDLPAYFASKKLGPEPTEEDFLIAPFVRALKSSKKPLKPYLLDQTLVVGLGNIYVDEVLWRAQLYPSQPSHRLLDQEITTLHEQIIAVLQLGIEKRGSTIRTYRNALGEDGTMQDFLMVYGRTGEPCARCGAEIEKMKVAGRGTHICPRCQVMR
ncbi:DNA-formamidopyrimidine glycosylase [Streptococcus pneumoniae]